MKITKTLQGFEGFKVNPNGVTVVLGAGLKNFPEATSIRDEKAFCKKKQELLDKRECRISTRNAIGENDRAVLDSLYLGKSAAYVTELGYHVGEIELPTGTAFAVISAVPDLSGKLRVSGTFKDNSTGRYRKLSMESGKYEVAAILLAMMSLIKERQDEEGSTELVDTLDDILSSADMEFAPYKFSGILYYEFLDSDELDFGENAEAGVINEFRPDMELSGIGNVEKAVFGKHTSTIITEDVVAKSEVNPTMDILANANKKYCNVERTKEEIEEKFGWFSLPDKGTEKQFLKVLKAITYPMRRPQINNAPFSIMLTGAAGTGKSTLAEVAAWLSGLEYRPVVASSEKFSETDVVATLVPNVEISNGDLFNSIAEKSGKMYLPEESSMESEYGVTYMDIFAAPAIAYEAIYGKAYEGDVPLNPESLCEEITRREVQKRINSGDKSKEKSGFMMVLTEIGRTLMFGGVAEAQEFNMIANLNESSYFYKILEERIFTLPNGMVMPVHKDAHLIFTMNTSENYTRELPPAFKTRHYRNIAFEPAGFEIMASQAVSRFEHDGIKLDYRQVRDMAAFLEQLREYADNDELISLRGLNNWIFASLDDESMYDSCIDTIINIASSDKSRRGSMIGMLQASPFFDAGIEATFIKDEEL